MANKNGQRILKNDTDLESLRRLNIPKDGNLDRVGTIIQELTPEKLASIFRESAMPGDMERLFELYEKIEAYDGKIKGLVEKRRKAPTRFPTKFKIKDHDHPRANEVKQFMEEVFEDIDRKKLMRNTMDGILHGVKLMEVVWYKNGDYIIPKQPVDISSSRYGQNNDRIGVGPNPDFGRLQIRKSLSYDDYLFVDSIDEDKIYKAIYKDKRGFYDIGGAMRPLLKWYLFKYYAAQYWVEYDETYGFPTATVTVPKGDYTEYRDELEEFLSSVGRNKFGVLFDGMEYEITSSNSSGRIDVFRELIRFANKEIIYAITGQDLTEKGSTPSSYAESVVGYEIEVDIMIDDAEFVDKCINENIVKPTIQANFVDVPLNIVEFYTNTPERKDWQKIIKKWETAAKLGLKGVSKQQISDELEIEFSEDEDDSIDLYWQQKPNTGGDHPPAEERERDDGGSVADME